MRPAIQLAKQPTKARSRETASAATSAPPTQPPNPSIEVSFHLNRPLRHRRFWISTLLNWFGRFQRFSAATISGLVHLALLLVLAFLVTIEPGTGRSSIEVTSTMDQDTLIDPSFEIFQPASASPDSPDVEHIEVARPAQLASQLPADQVESTTSESVTLAAMTPIQVRAELDQSSDQRVALMPTIPAFAHSSLDGRSAENRTKLALTRGGTKASEQAVEAALAWLTAHQYRDGGWSTVFEDPNGPCLGRCSMGSFEPTRDRKRFAATGLALLTYLGAGYTHREGKYREQVYRGLGFLMDNLKLDEPNDDPRHPGQFSSMLSNHVMYEQGIAALAICEAYQMTRDPILKKSAQLATDYILKAQHYDGSWGYRPQQSGDLSIVGWQMMALKSAHASELDIETFKIRRVDKFLNARQSYGGARYSYRAGGEATRSITAIGLLMRLYLGYSRSSPPLLAGAAFISEKGPSQNDVYFNYYGTQALFQMESSRWPKWNELLREYLIKNQSKAGHEAGSWFFEGDHFNEIGGRLYTTTLSAMTLEVYYRYMPVYNDTNDKPFEL